MPAITTKVDICNLAIGGSGNRNTITNIDTPKNDKEIICSLWYEITRQLCLKTQMPNFALNRIIVSAKTVPDGYALAYRYAFEYPHRCLKLLGIGDIDCTNPNNVPTIENGLIFTNTEYPDGMPIRFIDDIEDVTAMSPEFIIALAKDLEKRITMAISQDPGKRKMASDEAAREAANASALNAQENKPIRKSVSRFRNARFVNQSHNASKP